MSSSSSKPPQSNGSDQHEADACAGWSLFIGVVVGVLPALVMGGRWWALPIFTCAIGWFIGALVDRSRK